eukprot:7377622-Prymnesium_polylepis.2
MVFSSAASRRVPTVALYRSSAANRWHEAARTAKISGSVVTMSSANWRSSSSRRSMSGDRSGNQSTMMASRSRHRTLHSRGWICAL